MEEDQQPPSQSEVVAAEGVASETDENIPETMNTEEIEQDDSEELQVGAEVRSLPVEAVEYENIGEEDAKTQELEKEDDSGAVNRVINDSDAPVEEPPVYDNPSAHIQVDAADFPAPESRQGEKIEQSINIPDPKKSSSGPIYENQNDPKGYLSSDKSSTRLRDVMVVAIIMPMGCRVQIRIPTMIPPGEGGVRSRPDNFVLSSTGWGIDARPLFEELAIKMGVHPQTFHVYRNRKRIRFTDFVSLLDLESAPEGDSRVWVTVTFPNEQELDNASDSQCGKEEQSDEFVPEHLKCLSKGDFLVRSIQVQRITPLITPEILVEGKKSGYSFDEVIRFIHRNQTIESDGSDLCIVSVLHDPRGIRKPFLGGYRNKKNGHEIHHASTQLFMPGFNYSPFSKDGKFPPARDMCSRQTQTYGISRSCQTKREATTQTPRPDIYYDNLYDYIVIAKPYFSAEQLLELRIEKSIIIQKMYRQWKARQIRNALMEKELRKQQQATAMQLAEEASRAAEASKKYESRVDPHTAKDFEALRNEIEAWRAVEAKRIMENTSLTDTERRAALLALTKQELKLIQELEHRKSMALGVNKEKRFDESLVNMSMCKKWGTVQVSTPYTERAAELRALYRSLIDTPSSNISQRLDVLLHVKWTVKEFDGSSTAASNPAASLKTSNISNRYICKIVEDPPKPRNSREKSFMNVQAAGGPSHNRIRHDRGRTSLPSEICELIDREADLLQRGRKESTLEGLRKRLQDLFKQFIQDPQYNPIMGEHTTTALGRAKADTFFSNRENPTTMLSKIPSR